MKEKNSNEVIKDSSIIKDKNKSSILILFFNKNIITYFPNQTIYRPCKKRLLNFNRNK